MILPSALPNNLASACAPQSASRSTRAGTAELAGAFIALAPIDLAHQNLQAGQMLGGLVMLGLVSAAADRGFGTLSRRLVWWS